MSVNLGAPSWLVDFLSGVSVWDALLWVVGIGLFVWFIKAKGWRTVVALARGLINAAEVLAAVQGLPGFIERTDETLAAHKKQLENSHSTNLRDDVTDAVETARRVEEGVKGLYTRLEGVEGEVRSLHDTDNELREEIEHTREPKGQRP